MEGQTISTGQKKKTSKKYERFGEVIRYLTTNELSQFFDSIDNYKHKLIFEIIYELGCRVGEFVRIQVKHLNFNRSTVFFPAENTKTKHARISYLPKGLTNEIKSMLKQRGIMNKRGDRIKNSEAHLTFYRRPFRFFLNREGRSEKSAIRKAECGMFFIFTKRVITRLRSCKMCLSLCIILLQNVFETLDSDRLYSF
jgi:integrase